MRKPRMADVGKFFLRTSQRNRMFAPCKRRGPPKDHHPALRRRFPSGTRNQDLHDGQHRQLLWERGCGADSQVGRCGNGTSALCRRHRHWLCLRRPTLSTRGSQNRFPYFRARGGSQTGPRPTGCPAIRTTPYANPRPLPNHQMFCFSAFCSPESRSVRHNIHHDYWLCLLALSRR